MEQQIRHFLMWVLGGFFFSVILVFAVAYYYGPTGSSLAGNVLLSPVVIKKLSYTEGGYQGKTVERYIFDSLELLYFSLADREWKSVAVSMEDYKSFFEAVESNHSLVSPSEEVIALFSKGYSSRLFLKVKKINGIEGVRNKVFQEVAFSSDGNYFRVELHQANSIREWAYFYQPGIVKLMTSLFVRSS